MLSSTLQECSLELGRALAQTPAVAAFRRAEAALRRDDDARTALEALQAHSALLNARQQVGAVPTPAETAELRIRQEAVRANETVMGYLRATNDVKAYLPRVAQHLSASLGTDFAALVTSGNC